MSDGGPGHSRRIYSLREKEIHALAVAHPCLSSLPWVVCFLSFFLFVCLFQSLFAVSLSPILAHIQRERFLAIPNNSNTHT